MAGPNVLASHEQQELKQIQIESSRHKSTSSSLTPSCNGTLFGNDFDANDPSYWRSAFFSDSTMRISPPHQLWQAEPG